MSIRPSAPAAQRTISTPSLQQSLKSEQSQVAEDVQKASATQTSPKAQQLADVQTTAKANESATRAPNAAAVGAFQTDKLERVARKPTSAIAGQVADAALEGARKDTPPSSVPAGPAPDLPGAARGIDLGNRKELTAPGELSFDKPAGLLVQSGGIQSLTDARSPASAVRDQLVTLTDKAGAQKGVDQGFEKPPTSVGSADGVRAAVGKGGMAGLLSGGLGGVLGEAAASEVKGARDTSGLVADKKGDAEAKADLAAQRQVELNVRLNEAAQRSKLEQDQKQPSGDLVKNLKQQPVPEGEGRAPDRLNLVGGSLTVQQQKAAQEAGKRGSEVNPAPEGNVNLKVGGVVVPTTSETQRNLVGQPGEPQRGAPQLATNFGGKAGAIDPPRDEVHNTVGGRVQDPAEFFDRQKPLRDFPDTAIKKDGDKSGS